MTNREVTITNTDNTFVSVDDLADKQQLIKCYQMQVDSNNVCRPVLLGSYPDVPFPVNEKIPLKKSILYTVTYVLTEKEINDKLFKIVGAVVFNKNENNSLYSVDLVANEDQKSYQLILNNHTSKSSKVIENVEKFPDRDKVFEYVLNKTFEEPTIIQLLK